MTKFGGKGARICSQCAGGTSVDAGRGELLRVEAPQLRLVALSDLSELVDRSFRELALAPLYDRAAPLLGGALAAHRK